MNTNLPNLHMPSMIPVNSAAITITTCFAEKADQLMDLKRYFQVHSHLVSLLNTDDTEEVVNWYDGRPKSMFLTIWTSNQAAMAYAFSQDLVDEDLTIKTSIRDYLQCQEFSSESVEALFDEFMVPQANLKQAEGGHLIVDFGDELIGT
jgi:hypothetical protein